VRGAGVRGPRDAPQSDYWGFFLPDLRTGSGHTHDTRAKMATYTYTHTHTHTHTRPLVQGMTQSLVGVAFGTAPLVLFLCFFGF
jgi:hypothetical protein